MPKSPAKDKYILSSPAGISPIVPILDIETTSSKPTQVAMQQQSLGSGSSDGSKKAKKSKLNAGTKPSADGSWKCVECGCPESMTPVKRISASGKRDICNRCYIRNRTQKDRLLRGSARPDAPTFGIMPASSNFAQPSMRYQPFGGATAATGATPYYQAPSAYTYAAMHTDPSGYYASFGMPTQGYDPTASGMFDPYAQFHQTTTSPPSQLMTQPVYHTSPPKQQQPLQPPSSVMLTSPSKDFFGSQKETGFFASESNSPKLPFLLSPESESVNVPGVLSGFTSSGANLDDEEEPVRKQRKGGNAAPAVDELTQQKRNARPSKRANKMMMM